MQENIPWIEKYRPLHFDDIVLDPLNKTLFQNILKNRYFPNLLFYGPPGTGKTTTIINIINEYNSVSKPKHNGNHKENVIHLNASDERGIDIIRYQINQFVKSNHLFETGLKFVILDEVDYMTKNAQQALKSLLQTCRLNVRFCLICNYISKIDESLKNEFCCVRFNQLPVKEIYTFIRYITDSEKVNITNEDIETIQFNYQSDIRSMINFIQLNSNAFITNNSDNSDSTENSEGYSKIVKNENWQMLHYYLMKMDSLEDTSQKTNEFDAETYIHYISVRFNIDKRNILNMYLNYVLRTYPKLINDEWLNIAEIVIHTTDAEIKDILHYFCVNFSEYYYRVSG